MLQCEVIGNIGSDAEVKNFNGKDYVAFNVAHSERRRDGGEQTTWVSVLWYGNGGNLLQYLKRGCKVFVRGRLAVKTYQDKNGVYQAAVNVSANEVTLCGSKGEGNAAPQPGATQQADPNNPGDDLPF